MAAGRLPGAIESLEARALNKPAGLPVRRVAAGMADLALPALGAANPPDPRPCSAPGNPQVSYG